MTDTQPTKPAVKAEKSDLAEGVTFTRPTSQLDLEARQKAGNKVEGVLTTTNPKAPDDSGFIGTDPIYQSRANESDQPLAAEEGPDAVAEADFVKSFEKPDHAAAARKKAAAEKAAEKS